MHNDFVGGTNGFDFEVDNWSKALSQEETEEQLKILRALFRTRPVDAFHCNKLSLLPTFLQSALNRFLNDEDCWKRDYVARMFPEYQLGLIGPHGSGKSTLFQWIGAYAGKDSTTLKLQNPVCRGGDESCTEIYRGYMLPDKTHKLYDPEGLES